MKLFQEEALKILLLHSCGLEILLLLELLFPAPGIEPVQKDLFPIDFVILIVLPLLVQLHLFLLVGLGHLEEGVYRQLLFEVLLQVEQRHVKQLHRLV